MFSEMIDRLKAIKENLFNFKKNDESLQKKETTFDIKLTKNDGIFKLEISDYISVINYIERMELIDNYNVTPLLSTMVFWNSKKQKVNKGTYYIIEYDNIIYNILINDFNIYVDQKEKINGITEEKVIYYNSEDNTYYYSSLKHRENGSTFFTKFYNSSGVSLVPESMLSREEVFEDISLILCNLKKINGIEKIFDTSLFEKYILDRLDIDTLQNKKTI